MESNGISRRRMLQLTGLSTLSLGMAALVGCDEKEPETPAEPVNTPVTLKVYDPTGQTEVSHEFNPRLETLEGKTIGFVSDGIWQDDRTFPVIKEILEERYPGIKIYDQHNFGIGNDAMTDPSVAETALELGLDGVIVGNAG